LERFDGEGIFLVDADAEEIAGEHETRYLAAAIGKQGVEFQGAMRDHEHALRWVPFMEGRLFGLQSLHCPKRAHAG
jgi:hypothetical protein